MYSTLEQCPIKVLLVESHHFTRLGLRSALSTTNAVSVSAEADGPIAALQALDQVHIDVAVVGAEADSASGSFDICRALREKRPTLKVIMLLPPNEINAMRGSVRGGAHAYGLKNVNAERLMAAIISVFYGDTWVDAAVAECFFRELIRENQQEERGSHGADSFPEGRMSECATVLTQREAEVLELIVRGYTNQAIADQLVVSLATAKAHVRSILCKLSVAHRTEAAVEAIRRGLV